MSPPPRRRPSMLSPSRAEAPAEEPAPRARRPSLAPPPRPEGAAAPARAATGFGARFSAPKPLAPLPEAPPDPSAPPFGRSAWPPPPGSPYDDFLMWASEGAGAFLESDVDLAIDLFMGRIPHPGCGPAEPGSAGPSPGF